MIRLVSQRGRVGKGAPPWARRRALDRHDGTLPGLQARTLRALACAALLCAGCAAGPGEAARQIGPVCAYPASGRAEVPGVVCLDKGILDYLAVAPESGKEYESLLVLECRPSELHAALLTLGARPGSIDPAFKADRRGDPLDANGRLLEDKRPRGDRVQIAVRRAEDADWTPVEAWITERGAQQPPERLEWVFTGSFFATAGDGVERYLADVYNTVAAVWYDGIAPLNLASAAGSPYRGDALGYEIRTERVPPVGTKVGVAFRLVKRPGGN